MNDWTLEVLRGLGYLGLVLVLIIENIFPPIPSEVVLPLAGFLVSQEQLSFWGAVTAATAGAYVGALILYALGRWGGRPTILRYGNLLHINEKSLKRAEEWFKRYGDWIVLFARVVPLARSIVSVPAGTMRMPLLRFTLLTIVGTASWNILLIWLGWLLGENWKAVSHWAGTYSDMVVILLGVAVVTFVVYLLVRGVLRAG